MVDIALFPIPGCVVFPHVTFPLHVFEPRYRTMVRYCLKNDMMVGICHTQKVLHTSKHNHTVQEILSSNQSTYKPYPVFSAGPCELITELSDGRMLIHVYIEERFIAQKQTQTLPFSICDCEPYQDHRVSSTEMEDVKLTQQKLLHRLYALTNGNRRVQALLNSDEWQNKDPIAFSFDLFSLIQCSADLQQHLLECQSPAERLHNVLELLNQTH